MHKTVIMALSSTMVVAGLSAFGANAQQDKMYRPPAQPEAIIYRDMRYSGPAMNVRSANQNMGLAWPVGSIRVRSGAWQLCGRTRFRTPCITVSADNPNLNFQLPGNYVASMRPVAAPPITRPPGAGSFGPSLRGMAAEFYPAPQQNGQRLLSCARGPATADCAARSADDFCRRAGWTASASQTQETVGRQIYLADVLCTRRAN